MPGKPRIQEFHFNANQQLLTCISTGGPATDVIWRRNKARLNMDGIKYSQVQMIDDMAERSYINILRIRKLDPADVAGNYSCTVSNIRGNDDRSVEIKGEDV